MLSIGSSTRRRLLLVAALVVTFGALLAPALVPTDETYSVSYVGTDYEADAVRDTAVFWGSLDEDERSALTEARRKGTVTLSERPQFVDADEDTRFSVVRDETVSQFRLQYATDPWWREHRIAAVLVGVVGVVATVGWGAVRRVETLWD
jgi:hypothetical protein